MRFITLIIISLSICSCSQEEKEHSTIIPQVQEILHSASYFDLTNFQIYADENALTSAELLVLELERIDYKLDSILSFEDPIELNSVNLLIDTSLNDNFEYYELTIKKDFVLIKGASREGLIHGIYSLIQLIPRSSGIDDSKLACASIHDKKLFQYQSYLPPS
jgi:N-acetyl-beta-hexosaminidase